MIDREQVQVELKKMEDEITAFRLNHYDDSISDMVGAKIKTERQLEAFNKTKLYNVKAFIGLISCYVDFKLKHKRNKELYAQAMDIINNEALGKLEQEIECLDELDKLELKEAIRNIKWHQTFKTLNTSVRDTFVLELEKTRQTVISNSYLYAVALLATGLLIVKLF